MLQRIRQAERNWNRDYGEWMQQRLQDTDGCHCAVCWVCCATCVMSLVIICALFWCHLRCQTDSCSRICACVSVSMLFLLVIVSFGPLWHTLAQGTRCAAFCNWWEAAARSVVVCLKRCCARMARPPASREQLDDANSMLLSFQELDTDSFMSLLDESHSLMDIQMQITRMSESILQRIREKEVFHVWILETHTFPFCLSGLIEEYLADST
jgi:hypothetical protein